MATSFSWVRKVSQIGTLLMTALCGEKVGQDSAGNRYYTSRCCLFHAPRKRWVLYKDAPEATTIPIEWYGWLHHFCDQPLRTEGPTRYGWLRPREPNLTGTEAARFPAGYDRPHPHHKASAFIHRAARPWQPPE